jgi:hypothetical protein
VKTKPKFRIGQRVNYLKDSRGLSFIVVNVRGYKSGHHKADPDYREYFYEIEKGILADYVAEQWLASAPNGVELMMGVL